jgi:hypothetical protein
MCCITSGFTADSGQRAALAGKPQRSALMTGIINEITI